MSGFRLSEDQRAYLDRVGWDTRVSGGLGIWVSVDEQTVRLIRGGAVIWEAPCSTSAKGTGQTMGSYKTPLGWHRVARKVGEGARWGQVFRDRKATNEVWRPDADIDEDLILTRILVLSGEEPGFNQGGEVDSLARRIYVHGTNAEDRIGTPASHGCVRLRNDDAIALFDQTPEDTPVVITERTSAERGRT